jgi:protein involved in polysaccharide export with SLBB domain
VGAAASPSNIKVSVVGSSLVTSTDSAGQFVLTGVPAGRVELRFEGPGLDARLEIAGLAEGQEIHITVKASGNGVVLVSGDTRRPGQVSPSPETTTGTSRVQGQLESLSVRRSWSRARRS